MTDTKMTLLGEAEILLRQKGYAAFSYADLAEKVGIRKASIHHHFATKEDLGKILVDNYLDRFVRNLEEISETYDEYSDRLKAYTSLFFEATRDHRLPLCCALAVDLNSMPTSLQHKTQQFFGVHITWLTRIIGDAIRKGQLRNSLNAHHLATIILSALEGASIVSLALGNEDVVNNVLDGILTHL